MNTIRLRALSVHLLTATGAVFSMLAIIAAANSAWETMYLWLVVAFAVDGIDGPLARRYHVKTQAAEIDGVLLDLIIDYLTYVFIPAFALYQSGLLPGWTGWFGVLLIAFASSVYFADTRMKTEDNSFWGFPGCWNMVVLVFFAVEPHWTVMVGVILALTPTMFLPLKFIHPVRTERWRGLSLPLAGIWVALALFATLTNFNLPDWAEVALIVVSAYLLFVGMVQQLIPARAGRS
ncbi:CDP-alcohol phosphatidyltransferase family protein [Pseudooceanicola marinus]|uniref:CDP-alcohol phosphatidyltransferase family protein n=1 Tax=Pseudooceanicola marinus TaxID=396013 RepID=UPI001C948829|nr:CDP-alcohol phosphatidyltransferase family protein [Pseudooceanicola marinus]MBY5972789.1 CDP-alcohol phosphatidyltransferase family protein [Ferrimonas balearica]MCA1336645.1 CDP-alcohol phosphatidyltransferase family protein [Pseudooceanicola marinus]